MTEPMRYGIDDKIKVQVNCHDSELTIIGYELGWWLDPVDWSFIATIPECGFTFKVTQRELQSGVQLTTNGNYVKVLSHAKVKAK